MFELMRKIFEFVGIFVIITILLYLIFKLLISLFKVCTTRKFQWCGGQDTWAVITGSTDGIGLAYAKQLAEKGYNLLLISRNAMKLSKVSDEIQTMHSKCLIRTLAIDFTQNDIYDRIEEELKSLSEIHVLVNNVGIAYPNSCPEYFTQIPDLTQYINSCINVNIISCTRLMAMILPRMEAKGRGLIINLSSFTAKFPIPLLCLYSATKVYIDYLSRALNEEYKRKGIVIQSVLPFYVSTKMIKNIKTSLLIPAPDQYVKSALKTVGTESQTFGYFSHKLFAWTQDIGSHLFGTDFYIKMAFIHFQELRRRFYANEDITHMSLRLFIPTKD